MAELDLPTLRQALKTLIIEECDRDDLRVEDIDDDVQLIGRGLGLDSLDALQIAMAVQNTYGLRIEGNRASRKHLASVNALAHAILQQRA